MYTLPCLAVATVFCGTLLTSANAKAQARIHFSTETNFQATIGPKAGQTITHGDECATDGEVVLSNLELVLAFCPKPIPPNFGLDALHREPGRVYFSTEDDWFAPCGGQEISDGDLLTSEGQIFARNAQLMQNFRPMPPVGDVGLDAVHILNLPGGPPMLLFSIEVSIFDEALGVMLNHGDVLNANGTVFATNADLIQNFCAKPVQPDVGLDALYLPHPNEIWFSTEERFFSECLSQFIEPDDLLSNAGHIVRSNRQLLSGFRPANTTAGPAGLDAVWAEAGPPLEPIALCGELTTGPQSCTLLQGDNGGTYAVQNTGGFALGTRVWVEGWLNPQSQECFPVQIPAIENNTIALCFEDCGTLEAGPQGCPILRLHDNTFVFIQNIGNEPLGSRVFVQGPFNENSTICAPLVRPAVERNVIGPCFQECGNLVETPFGCPAIETNQGIVLIENRGSFVAGDRVWVEGPFSYNSQTCPTNAIPVVLNNRIFECFEDCGRLVLGILCTQFEASDGSLYALDNYGDFDLDNELFVRGGRNPNSQLCPPLPSFPGIEGNSIGLCYRDCGVFVPGPQGCPRFIGSDGVARFIEKTPNFPVGNQPFWVMGLLNPESQVCLPFTAPGIEENTVGECFDARGVYHEGPDGCNLFVADGGGFYCLENTVGIRPGSRIRVRGSRSTACGCPCPLDIPLVCIFDNVNIGPLGDMNCDGLVTVTDIGGFVLAVTRPDLYPQQFPDCNINHGDINCDGRVTVSDIGPFVTLLVNTP